MGIATLCNDIQDALHRVDPYSASKLRQALPVQEVQQSFNKLLCEVPESVINLYQWCDGNPAANRFILSNYYMLSLENILDIYQNTRSHFAILDLLEISGKISDKFSPINIEDIWPRNWIPILCHLDYSRFWLVSVQENSCPVLFFDPEEGYVDELYSSLEAMLKSELECFRAFLRHAEEAGLHAEEYLEEVGEWHQYLQDIRCKYGFKKTYLYGPL